MVVELKNRDGALESSKRFPAHSANPQEITTQSLDEFGTNSTQTFFDRLCIETEFLDRVTWDQREGFKKRLSTVKELQVLNDIAKKRSYID